MENAEDIKLLKIIQQPQQKFWPEEFNRFLYCCDSRWNQDQKIKQKKEESKNNIREFLLSQEKDSKFYLPAEMVEKICSVVSFNEKAVHSPLCFLKPEPENIFERCNNMPIYFNDVYLNRIVETIPNNIIVGKWHESWHSEQDIS